MTKEINIAIDQISDLNLFEDEILRTNNTNHKTVNLKFDKFDTLLEDIVIEDLKSKEGKDKFYLILLYNNEYKYFKAIILMINEYGENRMLDYGIFNNPKDIPELNRSLSDHLLYHSCSYRTNNPKSIKSLLFNEKEPNSQIYAITELNFGNISTLLNCNIEFKISIIYNTLDNKLNKAENFNSTNFSQMYSTVHIVDLDEEIENMQEQGDPINLFMLAGLSTNVNSVKVFRELQDLKNALEPFLIYEKIKSNEDHGFEITRFTEEENTDQYRGYFHRILRTCSNNYYSTCSIINGKLITSLSSRTHIVENDIDSRDGALGFSFKEGHVRSQSTDYLNQENAFVTSFKSLDFEDSIIPRMAYHFVLNVDGVDKTYYPKYHRNEFILDMVPEDINEIIVVAPATYESAFSGKVNGREDNAKLAKQLNNKKEFISYHYFETDNIVHMYPVKFLEPTIFNTTAQDTKNYTKEDFYPFELKTIKNTASFAQSCLHDIYDSCDDDIPSLTMTKQNSNLQFVFRVNSKAKAGIDIRVINIGQDQTSKLNSRMNMNPLSYLYNRENNNSQLYIKDLMTGFIVDLMQYLINATQKNEANIQLVMKRTTEDVPFFFCFKSKDAGIFNLYPYYSFFRIN